MLYTFLMTQWNNPTRGDWTEQVKQDLEDFDIPQSFELMENKSQETFKKLVKVRAKEYALKILLTKKGTKMENLSYSDLQIQKYLVSEETTVNQKKTIFKYRVRMERFGENFRGGNVPVMCPLCTLHLDNQEMGFQCPEILKEVQIKGRLEDIYRDDISIETIRTIMQISEIRKSRQE